jgi:spermidine/putrescine transport system ATP-binding protein
VDLVPAEKGQIQGTVTTVTFMGVHNEAIVDIDGFKWMIQTTDPVEEGAHVGITLEPDAIHIMKKSKYSGMFGDYSSFSNELDELSNAGEDEEE